MPNDQDPYRRVMLDLGLDPDDPKDIREARKDLEFARSTRQRCSTLWGKIITWGMLIAAGAVVGLLYDGFKSKFGAPR